MRDYTASCLILCFYTICTVAKITRATHHHPQSSVLAFASELPYSPLFACLPASQRCLSIPVYPMSWSQPNSDLLLVIQLLHPAGLHPLGLLVGGTREDGCAVLCGAACSLWGEEGGRPPCSITLISLHNRTELVQI